jgi:hypothetical protein
MKSMYKMLIAGMLATAPVLPTLATPTAVCVPMQITITDALAQRILSGVLVELQGQSAQELTVELLFAKYQQGLATISYLGYDGGAHHFQVNYDGSIGVESLEDL